MTAIVGLVENGEVFMGGDSAGVSGFSISVRADQKVFHNGPFLFGFTSSFRMGNLLKYKFSPPKQTVHQDDMQYLCTDFIDAIRACFKDNGYGKEDKGGTFLVGYNGNLYTIYDDFQVGQDVCNFDAVGCGSDLALGSLYSTKHMPPMDRVYLALEAAAHFSGGVSAPFIVLKQEANFNSTALT